MPKSPESFGRLDATGTLTIERVLPGPIERVWRYVTDSDLRQKWLAAGVMELERNANFTLTWRNDALTNPPGKRPEGFGAEHTMTSRILEVEAPRRLVFSWLQGEVSILLQEQGETVLLTLTHRRISDRKNTVMVGAGWHMHLDILVARVRGDADPAPFWEGWQALLDAYDQRVPV